MPFLTPIPQVYSIRKSYRDFSNWARAKGIHADNCLIELVFEYLLSLQESGLADSSLKVYLAAISAHHTKIQNTVLSPSVLRVVFFLKGLFHLLPLWPPIVSQWSLSVILSQLMHTPFKM